MIDRLIRGLRQTWHRFVCWVLRRPPILFVDADGVGWRKPPHWQDPTWPDEGQHDWAKIQMRIHLWRVVHGLPETPDHLDMSEIGLGNRRGQVPYLWPLGNQLAEACRRLGYLRLAQAAASDFADGKDFRRAWTQACRAAEEEAKRREKVNERTAYNWDPEVNGELVTPSYKETVAEFTPGAFDRPDLDLAKPLKPIDLQPPPRSTTYTSRRRSS